MIDWQRFPATFTRHAMDSFVFNPESPTHASEEQVRALLDHAERYLNSAAFPRIPGLGVSARATLRSCERALALANSANDQPKSPDAEAIADADETFRADGSIGSYDAPRADDATRSDGRPVSDEATGSDVASTAPARPARRPRWAKPFTQL